MDKVHGIGPFPGYGIFYLDEDDQPLFLQDRTGPYMTYKGFTGEWMSDTGIAIQLDMDTIHVEVYSVSGGNTQALNNYLGRALKQFPKLMDSYNYYLVVGPVQDEQDDEGFTTLSAPVGIIRVEEDRHLRLYGRPTEIPQQDITPDLTADDVDEVLLDTPKLDQVKSDKLLTLARKKDTNEILGVVVDLLKAGTGHYEGEAAQTIRNLVKDRLSEICVSDRSDVGMYRREYIQKAIVRMVALGQYLLGDGFKYEYYMKRVQERLSSMVPANTPEPPKGKATLRVVE